MTQESDSRNSVPGSPAGRDRREDSGARYRALFEHGPVAMLTLSRDGHVRESNRAASSLLGQPGALLTGSHARLLVRHEDAERLDRYLQDADALPGDLEVMVLHSSGRQVPVVLRCVALSAPGGAVAGLQMALMDASAHKLAQAELRQARDALRHQAQHDALTGLPNRLLFRDRLDQALLRARRLMRGVALLFVDVDRFKAVNDTLGHEGGDRALCEVARRLRASVRAVDTVARIGGDEFAVILERVEDLEQVLEIADKVRATVSEPLVLDVDGPRPITITCSLGVARYPQNGSDAAELLRRADMAMFGAKGSGRNRVQPSEPADPE